MDQPKWRGLFSLSVSWPIRHDPSVNCELWCHWSRAKNENLKTPWTHQQFSLSLWTSVGYHHHSTSIYIRASITRLSVAILRATCWRFSYIDSDVASDEKVMTRWMNLESPTAAGRRRSWPHEWFHIWGLVKKNGGFLSQKATPKSSIYRWIFHEINHPCLGTLQICTDVPPNPPRKSPDSHRAT